MRWLALLSACASCAALRGSARPLQIEDVTPRPVLSAQQLESVPRQRLSASAQTQFFSLRTVDVPAEPLTFPCGGFLFSQLPGLALELDGVAGETVVVPAAMDTAPFAIAVISRADDQPAQLSCGDRVPLPQKGRASVFVSRTPAGSTPGLSHPPDSWVAVVNPSQPLLAVPEYRPSGWALADRELERIYPVLRLRKPPSDSTRERQRLFELAPALAFAARTLSNAELVPIEGHRGATDEIAAGEPLALLGPSTPGRHRAVTADGQLYTLADGDLSNAAADNPVTWPRRVRGCETVSAMMALYGDASIAALVADLREKSKACGPLDMRELREDEYMVRPTHDDRVPECPISEPGDPRRPSCPPEVVAAQAELLRALVARRAEVIVGRMRALQGRKLP